MVVPVGERQQHAVGRLDSRLELVGEQRQHRLAESGEVPVGDARLVPERVAPAVVDRAEDRRRVVGVDERARPVVDRLARDRHVVGVHHAVHEPDQHPAGDERGLRLDHRLEEGDIRLLRVGGSGLVAGDGVVGEPPEQCHVAVHGDVLERSDSQMAAGDPGEDRAGQRHVAPHRLACRDDSERSGGRDAQCVHRLADEVLAQHRAERGAPVQAAGVRRRTRALEVEVTRRPITVDELPEQQRPAVAEAAGEAAELVPGVGLGDCGRALGQAVAGEGGDARRAAQHLHVETELNRQGLVQHHEPRVRQWRRAPGRREPFQVDEVRAQQRQRRPFGGDHRDDANATGWRGLGAGQAARRTAMRSWPRAIAQPVSSDAIGHAHP